jgi:uncharacterized protein (TIGR03067 family)
MKWAVFCLLFAAGPLLAADNPAQEHWSDKQHLQGTWSLVSWEGFSSQTSPDDLRTLKLTFQGDKILARYGADKTAEAVFKLLPTKEVPQIDVTVTEGPEAVKGKSVQGVYLLEGNRLRIAYRNPGGKRPGGFITTEGSDVNKQYLERMKH